MRVLLVNSLFGRHMSGSGHHVYTLWKYLRDRVEFEVWSIDNVGYINIPKLKSLTFYLKASMKEMPTDIDIVHIHNPKFAGLSTEKKRNIITVHGDYETELKILYGKLANPIIRYINRKMKKADIITTVSPYWSKLRGWKWIPNMIDLSEIEKIRPADESFLLFVGRDDPVKNYPMFREIAEQAYKRFGMRSLALGVERNDTEYLKHAKVSWEQVISYMKSALALVITSEQEGFPTVLLEAWAASCPVIAREIPPIETIYSIYSHALIMFKDVKEATEAISELEKNEKTLRSEGVKAVKDFDAPKVANKYENLYRKLLEG